MIVFALIANVSVPKLYLAATVPALILTSMFVLVIVGIGVLRPGVTGKPVEVTWRERLESLPHLLPPLAIFVLVIGVIYSGIATASESAALGVIAALGLAWSKKALNLTTLRHAFESTMRTTGMIILITLSAFFLNFVLSSIGLTTELVDFVVGLQLSPMGTMLALIAFYIILGCFMDTLAMMVMTAPLTVPIVVAMGFDPIWFGVMLILLCEMGQLTPPFGINLFVVQSIRAEGKFIDVIIGALPFCLALLLMLGLLLVLPQIALWLPTQFSVS